MNIEPNDTLETLVDRHGLAVVVAALAVVCFEKEEHVRANWQDAALARVWRIRAKRLDRLAGFVDRDGVTP